MEKLKYRYKNEDLLGSIEISIKNRCNVQQKKPGLARLLFYLIGFYFIILRRFRHLIRVHILIIHQFCQQRYRDILP